MSTFERQKEPANEQRERRSRRSDLGIFAMCAVAAIGAIASFVLLLVEMRAQPEASDEPVAAAKQVAEPTSKPASKATK